MAHIREIMAVGVPNGLARMLGNNQLNTVVAGGVGQADATPLVINFALIQTLVAGQGIRLGCASGAAITALYNVGPAAVNLYPAEDETLNDQTPNLPLSVAAGQTALAVPSIDAWLVQIPPGGPSGGIPEAPSDGNAYGRYNASWAPVLEIAGGTLSGPLVLAGDPTVASGAATKRYVDNIAALLAPLASPAFSGTPTAPTAPSATNTTQIATTAFVKAQNYLSTLTLAGDVVGSGASPLAATVEGLQGRPVAGTAPLDGQVLGWSAANSNWQPLPAPPAAAGGSTGQLQWNEAGVLAGVTISGDATINTATGVLTLAAVNANIGTFQGLTLDGKGRVTAAANMNYAPLASPAFTGTPTGPTPATADNSTNLATTAFVKAQGYLIANQAVTLSGDVNGSGVTAVPTTLATVNASVGTFQGLTLDGKGRVTAAANMNYAPLASPVFTGTPTGPTPATADNSTNLATTAFVKAQGYQTSAQISAVYAPIASPTFTGVPAAPTPATADNSTKLATTAYVQAQGYWVADSAWSFNSHNLLGTQNVSGNAGALFNGLQFTAIDGGNAALSLRAFGAGVPMVMTSAAGGTLASQSAVASGAILGNWQVRGYNGSAYPSASAQMYFITTEAWTTGANGTQVVFSITATGSTGGTTQLTIGMGVTVGAPTGGLKGLGTLNATTVYAAGTVLTSDASLKRDIAPVPDGCLALVEAIAPKTFRYRPSEADELPQGGPGFYERRNWGFVAQDIERAMSGHDFGGHIVGEDGLQGYSPADMLAVLWKAVQELQAEVTQLRGR